MICHPPSVRDVDLDATVFSDCTFIHRAFQGATGRPDGLQRISMTGDFIGSDWPFS
jgi:hypothetical protein